MSQIKDLVKEIRTPKYCNFAVYILIWQNARSKKDSYCPSSQNDPLTLLVYKKLDSQTRSIKGRVSLRTSVAAYGSKYYVLVGI